MGVSLATLAVGMLSCLTCTFVGSRLLWYRAVVSELSSRLAEAEGGLQRHRRVRLSVGGFQEAQSGGANDWGGRLIVDYRPAAAAAFAIEDGTSSHRIGPVGTDGGDGAARSAVLGQLLEVEGGRVRGWACTPHHPNTPLEVHAFVDGQLSASGNVSGAVMASSQGAPPGGLCCREGRVCIAGSGRGSSSWELLLPSLPEGEHQLRIFASTPAVGRLSRTELQGSPVNFLETATSPQLKDLLDRKDAMIRSKNLQLATLDGHLHTLSPWQAFASGSVGKKCKVFIAVTTRIDNMQQRRAARMTWVPTNEVQQKEGVIVKFVVGRSESHQDSGFKDLQKEAAVHNDIIFLQATDGSTDAPARMKHMLSTLPSMYDAQLYFKVDDDVVVNVAEVQRMADDAAETPGAYMGCFQTLKAVETDPRKETYEPEHARFGGENADSQAHFYVRHASSKAVGLSGTVVRYLAKNTDTLHTFADEGAQLGAWLLPLNIEYMDDPRFCSRQRANHTDKTQPCLFAFPDSKCGDGNGCDLGKKYREAHASCGGGSRQARGRRTPRRPWPGRRSPSGQDSDADFP